MKYIYKNLGVILLSLVIYSCNKENPIESISTRVVTEITSTSAVAGGINTIENGNTVTARGFCWAWEIQDPGIGHPSTTADAGTGPFIGIISGLTGNTTYYLRAYATSTNRGEVIYGNMIDFTTQIGTITFNSDLTYGVVSDVDGNTYKTIEIGTQTWMAENLRTTKFNDGEVILNVTDNKAWTQLTTQSYCWYNNDETNKYVYGALYNAISIDKLCPANWHVPSYDDWKTLTSFLGGIDVAGGKLKETGTAHWFGPNSVSDNASGFSAAGGGLRNSVTGTFDRLAWAGTWWSTYSQYVPYYGIYFVYTQEISSSSDKVFNRSYESKSALSIRCIKNN
jgi:uncharacterized protein (TIGR02145 family)